MYIQVTYGLTLCPLVFPPEEASAVMIRFEKVMMGRTEYSCCKIMGSKLEGKIKTQRQFEVDAGEVADSRLDVNHRKRG